MRRSILLTLSLALAALAAGGCQAFGPAGNNGEIDPLRVPTRTDIVSIQIFWSNPIWLLNSDSEPVGIQAPVYFVSGETQRGAFVDGNITVWMYELTPNASSRNDRKLLYEWKLDGPAERIFRVRRKAIGGYYYGLRLLWPSDLPVDGKQVEIVVGYTRPDGTVIRSLGRRDEIVPANRRRLLAPGRPSSAPSRYQAPVRNSGRSQATDRDAQAEDRRPLAPATGNGAAETTQTVDKQGRPTTVIDLRKRPR
jgi:hypothetical protein